MSNTTVVAKPFTWSYSVLKNFETCPKRYYHYNVARDVSEPETAQLREGDALHKTFEKRLLHGASLPLGYGQHEGILSKIVAAPGKLYGEQKLAITSSFQPSAYFAKDVWFRTIIDCAKVSETFAAIFDWKTGKIAEDITQLQLMAAAMFAHLPKLEHIRAGLVFTAHRHVEPASFVRSDVTGIWASILPRVRKVQEARAQQHYPPTPSGLCKKYCAVVSCPHHGVGR